LTLFDEVTSSRNGPAFCPPLTTGQVAFMNVRTMPDSLFPQYASGNGEIIPTVNGGTKFDNSTTGLETFPPVPGGVSNPHMAYEHGNEVFVPDLGGDKVWRIGHTAPGKIQHPRACRAAPRGRAAAHARPRCVSFCLYLLAHNISPSTLFLSLLLRVS
ncbi:hypothetical protein K438DRAFT_1619548, partial [Mycena galopus ATCC 62051]